jgi:hypothetical protein
MHSQNFQVRNPKGTYKTTSDYSVRASVIPCDIDGGLSEISFLIDFLPLNTISLKYLQKIQDGGDIRVGQKFLFFTSKIQKVRFFQKFFQGVVLSSTEIL